MSSTNFSYREPREAGATLADDERVHQVQTTEQGVQVETANRVFTAQIVVGADGARSVVAASAGLIERVDLGIGLEAEISVPGQRLVQWESLMGLDIGHMRGGYGWVFPKKDHLSVGVGIPLHQARRLKSGYQAVLKSHGLSNHTATGSEVTGCRCAGRERRSSLGGACCWGDAAGLVDPVTGEGIYNAVRSAKIAAPVIESYLNGSSTNLHEYEAMVDKQILPELKAARALARGFAWFPGLVFTAVEQTTGCGMPAAGCCGARILILHSTRRLGPAQVILNC